MKILDVQYHVEKNPGRNRLLRILGYNILSITNRLRNRISRESISPKIEVSKLEDDYETFWTKVSQEYDFIINRELSYMRWRYNEKGGNYTILKASTDDKQVGLIVYRINRINQEYPQGFILDLLTENNRSDVARALIEAMLNQLKSSGVNIVFWLGIHNSVYEKTLKSKGFVDTQIGFHLFYNTYFLWRKILKN
jgi:hypothetical protein